MCFVWICEQTAIISLYSINWLVFTTQTESVYCAVRTEHIYIYVYIYIYIILFYITLWSPVVTLCTTSLTFTNSTFCLHSVFMCFVWIWEQTAIISLYSINWLVFTTQTESVYCAVRTEHIYIILFYITLWSPVVTLCTTSLTFTNSTFCLHSVFMCFVWISEQTAIISLYSINWLVFITETESVYCAVRTGYI